MVKSMIHLILKLKFMRISIFDYFLDTPTPIAMATNLRQYLDKVAQSSDLEDLSKEHFEIVKKELYGDFFKSLDSIENLSAQFINHLSDEETYLAVPKFWLP